MKKITLTSTFLASLLITTSAPAVFAVEEEEIAPAALIIVEEASAVLDLDLEGIEEDIVEEIEESIREEIIEEETVDTILDETTEDPSDVFEEREEENREQWKEERESWLNVDQTVREQLNCEPGDSECAKKTGLTVRLMVAEKLYARVQERLNSIAEIPEEERDEELNELYASLQKLEVRFAARIERIEAGLDGSAEESLKNINSLRDNVNARFMEEGIKPERPVEGEKRGNRELEDEGYAEDGSGPTTMVDGQVQKPSAPSAQGEKPAKPENSAQGEKPAKPENSAQGEKPAKPENSAQGEKPAKPENGNRGSGSETKPNDKGRGQSDN